MTHSTTWLSASDTRTTDSSWRRGFLTHLAHLELTLAHLVLIEEHTWRPVTVVCSVTVLINTTSFEWFTMPVKHRLLIVLWAVNLYRRILVSATSFSRWALTVRFINVISNLTKRVGHLKIFLKWEVKSVLKRDQ